MQIEEGVLREAENLRQITPSEICLSSYHRKVEFNNCFIIQNISTALKFNKTVTENNQVNDYVDVV